MNEKTTGQPQQTSHAPQESVRETIDSIVIAFILAFVFRAFIIEAFVIPTGSMAATLNGAHGTMICQNCGWEFAYGLNDPASSPRSGVRFDEQSIAICQNCRFANDTRETNDAKHNQKSGDRILVFKWPFDLGGELLGPQRWDVVVFKTPSDGVTNFIKRLAGLPNEVLQIVDGDLYTVPTGELSKKTFATLDKARHLKYLQRADGDRSEIAELERELATSFGDALTELDGKMRIARKTDIAQHVLWRIAYDHDYPPQKVGDDQPHWSPTDDESGWSVGTRSLTFSNDDDEHHRVNLSVQLDSFCSYNTLPRWAMRSRNRYFPVSDLRVRCVLAFEATTGSVRIGLTKRDDVFVGELGADGTVRILRATVAAPNDLTEVCSKKIQDFDPHKSVELSFQNLDYELQLSVGGTPVLATNNSQYAPDIRQLRRSLAPQAEPPFISATDTQLTLTHIVVDTDQYYVSNSARPPLVTNWGTQNNPILLREGEFFMLGDNSAQSKDSRMWSRDDVGPHLTIRGEAYQQGTVPRDQLIGKAFFVYWPSGLRTSLIPFLRERGWIPNIGQMRWIR
ncbi:MAG: hypothetical protein GXP29_13470 [Planctomycetes bacterium]|nr:hypothetical protein [Planctomycetota bacterium]